MDETKEDARQVIKELEAKKKIRDFGEENSDSTKNKRSFGG